MDFIKELEPLILDKTDDDKDYNDTYKNLCHNRFAIPSFQPNTNVGGKGILVLGMNPAGDDKDARRDSDSNGFFLNYVDTISRETDFTNATYFKPIYETLSDIYDSNIKWDWCNLDASVLEKKLNQLNELTEFNLPTDPKNEAMNFYEKHKNNEVTVYIGDLFYIHVTSQKKLEQWLGINLDKLARDPSRWNYIKNSFNEHIDRLETAGVTDLAIFVNNATAGRLISKVIGNKGEESFFIYHYHNKDYKVFFGSMLSGGRAMDVFSQNRLIKEIKANL